MRGGAVTWGMVAGAGGRAGGGATGAGARRCWGCCAAASVKINVAVPKSNATSNRAIMDHPSVAFQQIEADNCGETLMLVKSMATQGNSIFGCVVAPIG
jgi:hypothetical protein